MKTTFKLTILSLFLLALTSCASGSKDHKGRSLASDPCAQRYFVDQESYFEYYEMCKDY